MFLQSYLPCEEVRAVSIKGKHLYHVCAVDGLHDLYSAAAVASKTYFLVQDRRVNICLFCFLG